MKLHDILNQLVSLYLDEFVSPIWTEVCGMFIKNVAFDQPTDIYFVVEKSGKVFSSINYSAETLTSYNKDDVFSCIPVAKENGLKVEVTENPVGFNEVNFLVNFTFEP